MGDKQTFDYDVIIIFVNIKPTNLRIYFIYQSIVLFIITMPTFITQIQFSHFNQNKRAILKQRSFHTPQCPLYINVIYLIQTLSQSQPKYIKIHQRIKAMIVESDIKMKRPRDSEESNYSATDCEIKSKYLGTWDRRSVRISLEDNSIEVVAKDPKKKKLYHIDEVNVVEEDNDKYVDLVVPNGRTYQIKANSDVMQTLQQIGYYKMFKKLQQTVDQQTAPQPLKLNYFATIRSLSFVQNYIPEHRSSIIMPMNFKVQKVFNRRPSYIKEEDWKRDEKKGGVFFINSDKRSIISKMISFIVKRVISTGSFMGISFPTFAMKPQTILETYCKCLGAAPIILDNISNDPVSRIKAFNAVILTMSLQFNDIEKPFNPTIGQTFQGEIAGYQVYAQQISHHPPVSSFLLDGKNYVLHGTLELNANLGLNSAVGVFYGEVAIEFDDGGVVRGRMPSGVLNGMVFGQTRFGPDGGAYSYDLQNRIVCTYEVKQKDIFTGYIGKLKPKAYQRFTSLLQSKSKQKYEKFKAYKESDYEKILSKMEAVWTSHVSYDGKMYFDYRRSQNLPYQMTQDISASGQRLLDSDSSFRLDKKLRAQQKLQESQDEKQKIEEQQRRLRKLRQKSTGKVQSRNSFH